MRLARCLVVIVSILFQIQGVTAKHLQKKVLTLATAQAIVAAAQAEAERLRLAGVIAVVDDGGWLVLLLRMDSAAYVASVELAPGKARTAALFKKSTEALENAINDGRVAAVTACDFTMMKGGLPIIVEGQVVGRVGASFDNPDHDAQIAQAGLAVLAR
jgi:glc operon protein GlcG